MLLLLYDNSYHFRFLIFYDIGYAQYVDLDDMFLVYKPSK